MNKNTNNKKLNKNKKAQSVKLKNILCAPVKIICPRLDDEELEKLQTLLKQNISESGEWKQKFSIGLESTLRAIKANEVKCVLLSQQLKPRYVLGLIARNVQVVDSTVPVFEHPELEEFCHNVFGIRSLAMIIRKVDDLDANILQWIRHNSKGITIQPSTAVMPILVKKKRRAESEVVEPSLAKKQKISEVIKPQETQKVTIESSADFLSLSSEKSDMQRITQNESALTKTMKKLTAKAQQSLYQPLVLHKIQPNVNNNRKKKKNKQK